MSLVVFQSLIPFLEYPTFLNALCVCKEWRDYVNANEDFAYKNQTFSSIHRFHFFEKSLLSVDPLYFNQVREEKEKDPQVSAWKTFFKLKIKPLIQDYERFKNLFAKHGEEWKDSYEKALSISLVLSPGRIPGSLLPDIDDGPVTGFTSSPGNHIGQLRLEELKDTLTSFVNLPPEGVLSFSYNPSEVVHETQEETEPSAKKRKVTAPLVDMRINSAVECLRANEQVFRDLKSYSEISKAFKRPEESDQLFIGGPTVDYQENYIVGKDEFLLLQYTIEDGPWWACFFIINKEELKKRNWSKIDTGDSLCR